MIIAIFAKEFGTDVSRAKKWKVRCSGGEPVNSCCQKGIWLFWKPLKIEWKGKIILIWRCQQLQGRLLAGREEWLCVYGSQECSVVPPLINADSGSSFSALGNDCVTVTSGLWGWDWLEKHLYFFSLIFLKWRSTVFTLGLLWIFKTRKVDLLFGCSLLVFSTFWK